MAVYQFQPTDMNVDTEVCGMSGTISNFMPKNTQYNYPKAIKQSRWSGGGEADAGVFNDKLFA